MQFASPYFLWLLAVIPLMVVYYVWRTRQGGASIQVSTIDGVAEAPRTVRYYLRHLPFALRCKGIPYRIYKGNSFYDHKEIKDLLAYIRLVINPRDDEAFKRIVNYPARSPPPSFQGIPFAHRYNGNTGTPALRTEHRRCRRRASGKTSHILHRSGAGRGSSR